MKNILKNKLLIVFVLCFILVSTISTSCFASSFDFQIIYEDKTYDVILSDKLKEYPYFILGETDDSYHIYLSSTPFVSSFYDHGNYDTFNCNSYHAFLKTDYNFEQFVEALASSGCTSWGMSNVPLSYCFYSSHDICDSEGNVVFQGAPPVNQIPEITKTLVEQTTQAQIQEQLKTMIIGFLKYLTVFVISVLAFWKGWKFLSKQFKTA